MAHLPSGRLDDADEFVHVATRAFAQGCPAPAPPADPTWVVRAVTAGVLAPVSVAISDSGTELPVALRDLRSETTARHLRHLHELRWVGGRLHAAGVPWAAMKGPVLRGVVFGRPQGRDYTDVDVLVSPQHIKAAVAALSEAGAVLLNQDWGSALAARTAEVALVLPHGSLLDLHWSILNLGDVRDGYDVPTRGLLERRHLIDVGGTPVWTLDRVDFVAHVLLHACQSGGNTLRWALDVQQSLHWLGDDVDRLRARARELGVQAPVRAAADLAQRFVDVTVDPRRAGGRTTAWTLLLDTASRRQPPSTPSLDTHGARTWYAATRGTAGRTALALVQHLVSHLRYRRSGWPEPRPVPATTSDPGYLSWVELAEKTGR